MAEFLKYNRIALEIPAGNELTTRLHIRIDENNGSILLQHQYRTDAITGRKGIDCR